MKYTSEIIIKLPIQDFIKKFDNPDNMKHWQQGLVDFEHIGGTPGSIGSKMKLKYKMGKRMIELTETITYRKLPYEFHAAYDTDGLHNLQENYFEETPEGHTKWTSKNEFIPTSFTLRMMTILMPKTFRRQSMTYLKAFKNFAEKGASVNYAQR